MNSFILSVKARDPSNIKPTSKTTKSQNIKAKIGGGGGQKIPIACLLPSYEVISVRGMAVKCNNLKRYANFLCH